MKKIVIVEDDLTLSLMLKTWLTKKNFSVTSVANITEAKKKIKEDIPEVVISDLRLPDGSGITLLKWMKNLNPSTIVIMMTGYADINSAVESIKSGAFDYIAKPLNPDDLLKKINNAFSQSEMRSPSPEPVNSNEKEKTKFVRGHSAPYKLLYEYIDLVAPTKMTVLIHGESGVGKEHIARLIHEKSDRATGPFVAVDCGVLSKELAASEFFGHIKGSFTGAINNKAGYFLTANGGTLFLDEIGNLPMDIQVQLLRALQEKKIKPVGSEKDTSIDVRVIVATNEKIDTNMANPTFRLDLYHRISEFILTVPSLKECKEDIGLFLHYFLENSNNDLGKKIIGFEPEALEVLLNYSWPGNIREMKNIVNRLTLLTTDQYISKDKIPDNMKNQVLNQ